MHLEDPVAGEALEPLLGQATRWESGPRAGTEMWGWDNPTGIAHDHVGVFASGVMTMPGLIVLMRAPRWPHRTASAITRSELPRLDSW